MLAHIPSGYSALLVLHLQSALKDLRIGLPRNSLPVIVQLDPGARPQDLFQCHLANLVPTTDPRILRNDTESLDEAV